MQSESTYVDIPPESTRVDIKNELVRLKWRQIAAKLSWLYNWLGGSVFSTLTSTCVDSATLGINWYDLGGQHKITRGESTIVYAGHHGALGAQNTNSLEPELASDLLSSYTWVAIAPDLASTLVGLQLRSAGLASHLSWSHNWVGIAPGSVAVFTKKKLRWRLTWLAMSMSNV